MDFIFCSTDEYFYEEKCQLKTNFIKIYKKLEKLSNEISFDFEHYNISDKEIFDYFYENPSEYLAISISDMA